MDTKSAMKTTFSVGDEVVFRSSLVLLRMAVRNMAGDSGADVLPRRIVAVRQAISETNAEVQECQVFPNVIDSSFSDTPWFNSIMFEPHFPPFDLEEMARQAYKNLHDFIDVRTRVALRLLALKNLNGLVTSLSEGCGDAIVYGGTGGTGKPQPFSGIVVRRP